MSAVTRAVGTLLLAAAAVAAGTWVWHHYTTTPWTREGRVRADVVTVAPDVSGWVTDLRVRDNQHVRKGDTLFSIDATRYEAKVDELQAKAAYAREQWQLARAQFSRRAALAKENALSAEVIDNARREEALAKANYRVANTALDAARIDLSRVNAISPVDGTVTNVGLRQGNYVHQGTAVLSVVADESFYVTAYFEETKLPLVKVGQTASMQLMGGGASMHGQVASIAKGVANGNTNADGQLLPQVQQAYNWVRLAQRIPVDIRLTEIPADANLSAGMTVSVELSSQGAQRAP